MNTFGENEEWFADGTRIITYPSGQKEVVGAGEKSSGEKERERQEKERQAKEKKDESKDKKDSKDNKPPEKPKKPAKEEDDEDDPNAQQNTTRVDPDSPNGGSEGRPLEYATFVPSVTERGYEALENMLIGKLQRFRPKPPSGGPTDSDAWTPFKSRTRANGPPESARGDVEANAVESFVRALGPMMKVGRPGGATDDAGQIPLGRASGDETYGTYTASIQNEVFRKMVWDVHIAPIINVAARAASGGARLRRVGRG